MFAPLTSVTVTIMLQGAVTSVHSMSQRFQSQAQNIPMTGVHTGVGVQDRLNNGTRHKQAAVTTSVYATGQHTNSNSICPVLAPSGHDLVHKAADIGLHFALDFINCVILEALHGVR